MSSHSASRAEESWQLARSLGESEVEELAHGLFTFAASYGGDLDAQIRWGEEARTHARRVRDPQAERTALRGLGAAHFSRGDFLRAIASCDGALAGRMMRRSSTPCSAFSMPMPPSPTSIARRIWWRGSGPWPSRSAIRGLAARAREAAAEYDLLAGSPGEAAQHFRAAASLLSQLRDTFERAMSEVDLAPAATSTAITQPPSTTTCAPRSCCGR